MVHILENREYTGCLVNFKTTTQSYKCSKIIYNSEDKQAIFENHHEQIIDRDTWERVQELRKQRKRPNRYDAEKRIAEPSAIFKRLYEDSGGGAQSDERFTGLSRTLEATANAEKFMKVVRKYTSFEELTPTLLREFVEKIVIHESEALDGKRRGKLRRQEIEIYYSFVGKVELPD